MRTLDAERLIGRRYRTYKFIYRFCKQERMEPERFWALPFDRLRFKLGESFRNLKVPFATAPALTNALTEALDELLALASKRHLGANAQVVSREIEETAVLPPLSHRLDDSESPALHERVVAATLGLDSWLDPALLRGWLAEPGRGAGFVRQLAAAYRKAFLEERALVRTEPTTYLTQLAVLRHVLPFWHARITASGTARFSERLEVASSVVLHAFFDEMIHAAFENPVLVDSTLIDVRAEYLLKTSVSPLTFMRDPSIVLRSEANPYGFSGELYMAVMSLWSGFDPLRQELDGMVDIATREISKAEELVADAVESSWLAELRRHIAATLSEDDEISDKASVELAKNAADPKLLRQTMRSRVSRTALIAKLDAAGGSDARQERFAALAAHMAAAEKLKREPSKAFGRAVVHESLVREAVRAVLVYQLDLTTRLIVERTGSLLLDRRMEDRTIIVAAEYDAGRLYRIAGDEHPLLRAENVSEEGHLFLDLKDFTKKTHSLKELNMADFLKGEFYGPLLKLARELSQDAGPGGSISLNNLLGDAISFSGSVKLLVDFAERAAEALDGYRDKLKSRMPESIVRGELQRLERQYELERSRIAEKRAQLEQILKELSSKFGTSDGDKTGVFAPGAGLIGEVTEATNALYKLEEREAQLERELVEKEEFLTGSDLVAGVFVSFGAPATVIKIADPVFGEVKVAIAEKINEAARGTARNSEVKRRLDLRVKEERERTGAALDYPFRVYIDKIWNLSVPPWMSESFRKAIEDKDPAAAGRVFNEASRAALSELTAQKEKKGPLSLTTVYANQDLYNAGVAISEQALGAYQKVAGKKQPFFVKTVDLSELDDHFHERFAFDTRRLRLVFVAGSSSSAPPKHVFRYAGSMVFRGFEQRTAVGVYELLNPRDAFHKLLVERCYGRWYKSFREKKGTDTRPFEPDADEEPTDPGMRGDA